MAPPVYSGSLDAAVEAVRSLSGLQLVGLSIVLSFVYRVAVVIYRLYFHPLAKYPGPKLYAASHLPFEINNHIHGTFTRIVTDLHAQYGPIVRIGPNHIDVDGSIGFPEICATKPGKPEWAKVKGWYFPGDHLSLLASDKENHRRLRRQLAHAFSDGSMYEQENYIRQYVDLLCTRVGEHADAGKALNVVRWFNFVTFDIIGDLTFGDSFHSLDTSGYHPWVALICGSIRGNAARKVGEQYPLIDKLMNFYGSVSADVQRQLETMRLASAKAQSRKAMGESPDGRRDFMTHMLKKTRDGGPGFSDEDLTANSPILVTAGSETTSTALAGAVFYLYNTPHVYKILTEEVRSAFGKEEEIDFKSTARLPYLAAVIEETLRIVPPGSELPPRISPGERLNGEFVPKGVKATINHYATYHNPANFDDPDVFHPERFLPETHELYDPKFANDNRAALKPFSAGTRDCIGKNLAYSELRLILSKLLFHFDWEVAPGQEDWHAKCKALSGTWEKPDLQVLFRRRK